MATRTSTAVQTTADAMRELGDQSLRTHSALQNIIRDIPLIGRVGDALGTVVSTAVNFGRLVGEVGSTLGKIGSAAASAGSSGLASAAGALGELSVAGGPAAIAVGAVVGGVVALTAAAYAFEATAVSTTSKYNPAVVEKLTLAQDDLTAVMGRSLLPVVSLVTEGTRLLGDTLISILPSTGEVATALAPISDLFSEIRTVLGDLAPDLKAFVQGGLVVLGAALKETTHIIKSVVDGLRVLGILGPGGKGLASSQGTAVREISFGGQEDYAKGVYEAAFRAAAGGGPKKDIGDVATTIDKIYGKMLDYEREAIQWVNDVKGTITSAAEKIHLPWGR